MQKTQAMRMLDARGIPYEARVYDAAGEFHSGQEAARLLGAEPASVYKTLVVLDEDAGRGRPWLVMLPVEDELDLRRLARLRAVKKLRMATQREAEKLTGLRVGAISALAVRPGTFEVLIDDCALSLDQVHVSAGQRGIDLALNPRDLMAAAGALPVALS